jgi:hypothetical protein
MMRANICPSDFGSSQRGEMRQSKFCVELLVCQRIANSSREEAWSASLAANAYRSKAMTTSPFLLVTFDLDMRTPASDQRRKNAKAKRKNACTGLKQSWVRRRLGTTPPFSVAAARQYAVEHIGTIGSGGGLRRILADVVWEFMAQPWSFNAAISFTI